MPTNNSFGASTRNRVLVIIGVIALSLWMIHPVRESLKLGLDLNGGVQLVLRVKTDEALQHLAQAGADRIPTRDEIVEQALRTIDRRANELGVAESVTARYTAADQILVQLPGVSDVDRAKSVIKSTAQLRLTLVERGPSTAATRRASPTATRCPRTSRSCRRRPSPSRPAPRPSRPSTWSSARRR
jgi:preprotein translocase subunit SecD